MTHLSQSLTFICNSVVNFLRYMACLKKQMLFFSPLVALLSRRLFLQVSKKKKDFEKSYLKRSTEANSIAYSTQEGQDKPSKFFISGNADLSQLEKLE